MGVMVEPQVYFLMAPAVGLVKIGRSIDIERRLQEIRLISPVPLVLLGFVPGDWALEAKYHEDWKHVREHGEWFRLTPELRTRLEADLIVSAWNRARQEARELALEQIDAPVFDRTRAA